MAFKFSLHHREYLLRLKDLVSSPKSSSTRSKTRGIETSQERNYIRHEGKQSMEIEEEHEFAEVFQHPSSKAKNKKKCSKEQQELQVEKKKTKRKLESILHSNRNISHDDDDDKLPSRKKKKTKREKQSNVDTTSELLCTNGSMKPSGRRSTTNNTKRIGKAPIKKKEPRQDSLHCSNVDKHDQSLILQEAITCLLSPWNISLSAPSLDILKQDTENIDFCDKDYKSLKRRKIFSCNAIDFVMSCLHRHLNKEAYHQVEIVHSSFFAEYYGSLEEYTNFPNIDYDKKKIVLVPFLHENSWSLIAIVNPKSNYRQENNGETIEPFFVYVFGDVKKQSMMISTKIYYWLDIESSSCPIIFKKISSSVDCSVYLLRAAFILMILSVEENILVDREEWSNANVKGKAQMIQALLQNNFLFEKMSQPSSNHIRSKIKEFASFLFETTESRI